MCSKNFSWWCTCDWKKWRVNQHCALVFTKVLQNSGLVRYVVRLYIRIQTFSLLFGFWYPDQKDHSGRLTRTSWMKVLSECLSPILKFIQNEKIHLPVAGESTIAWKQESRILLRYNGILVEIYAIFVGVTSSRNNVNNLRNWTLISSSLQSPVKWDAVPRCSNRYGQTCLSG